jgi:hypothetical protein
MSTVHKVLLPLVFLACSDDPQSTAGNTRYVGEIGQEASVKVGLVADGERVSVFFCGQGASAETATRWFGGISAPYDRTFVSEINGWTLTGTYGRESATGTLNRGDGKMLSWSVQRVDGEEFGLFERTEASGRAGVIFFPGPGATPAAQGVYINKGTKDEFLQITPLFPLIRTADGVQVKYTYRGVERMIAVKPVQP